MDVETALWKQHRGDEGRSRRLDLADPDRTGRRQDGVLPARFPPAQSFEEVRRYAVGSCRLNEVGFERQALWVGEELCGQAPTSPDGATEYEARAMLWPGRRRCEPA